jgi:hypothetical protein
MSGEKRTFVSVPDEELRRLRDQESRLKTIQSDLPARLEAIRKEAKQEVERRLAPIEHRIADQEQENKNMKSQLEVIMVEARQKQTKARNFFEDLLRLLKETETLPHNRFAPGELDAVRRNVEDARCNYESNMHEASLSTAQQAYWTIADLREQVLIKQREFIKAQHLALQEARLLLEEARENRRHQLEIGQGDDSEILALEVNYWTDGELSSYEDTIRELEQQLIINEDTLTLEQVKHILEEIESMKPELGEIVERAIKNILASQLRVNMTEVIIRSLEKQGFTLEDADYEEGDQRKAHVAKVKNIAGSEVVTIISAVQNEEGKNLVSINSYDETFVDDQTLEQRAKEITTILNQAGLEVEQPVCAGAAKPEHREIKKVQRGSLQAKDVDGR